MVFSSLLFIFAFLAPQLVLYFIIRNHKARNAILIVFSLVFYGFGGPLYLILLVLESFVSFLTAREISKTSFDVMKKRWLILEIAVLLGLLAVFKYLGFF
ncbi:MAG: MBOAT family protein, partial [Lachnospiraceae bacterium]|nr:MBOAT family protein [Lachnospiraceae bacterium]